VRSRHLLRTHPGRHLPENGVRTGSAQVADVTRPLQPHHHPRREGQRATRRWSVHLTRASLREPGPVADSPHRAGCGTTDPPLHELSDGIFVYVVFRGHRSTASTCLTGASAASTVTRSPVRHHGAMSARPLSRGEIAELADRLRGLLDMIAAGEIEAATGMTYKLQGAVVVLDAVLARQGGGAHRERTGEGAHLGGDSRRAER
jgi:hypothetical protein